jgi:chromosomal replication initiation ATPase DnaA
MNQLHAIPIESVELHWRGAALGSVRDGRFCSERFTLVELQEMAAVIADLLTPRRREVLQIVDLVAAEYEIDATEILSGGKRANVADARKLAISLVGDFFGHMGDERIAAIFQRDRSAATWSRNQVKNRCDTEPKFKELVARLRRKCQDKLFPKSKAA